MDDCTKELPASGPVDSTNESKGTRRCETERCDQDVSVRSMSRGKSAPDTSRPKDLADDCERQEDFRSGDSVFLLDRKPIWMTPSPGSARHSPEPPLPLLQLARGCDRLRRTVNNEDLTPIRAQYPQIYLFHNSDCLSCCTTSGTKASTPCSAAIRAISTYP